MIKLSWEQWEAFRLDAHRRYEAAGAALPSDGFLEDALLARGFELPDPLPMIRTFGRINVFFRQDSQQDWQPLGVEAFGIEIIPDPDKIHQIRQMVNWEVNPQALQQEPERKPKKPSLFHDPKKPKRKDWWNR
jgi:hypothetical protein